MKTMDTDKFVAMLEKQHNENSAETVKTVVNWLEGHMLTSQDAAKTIGVSVATFGGFWSETPENDPSYELNRLAQSGAIESKLWNGKRYMADIIASVATKRAELYAGRERIRRTALVTKGMVMEFASLKDITPEGDTAGAMLDSVAAKLGCKSEQLTAAIVQFNDQMRDERQRKLAAIAATLVPTKTE